MLIADRTVPAPAGPESGEPLIVQRAALLRICGATIGSLEPFRSKQIAETLREVQELSARLSDLSSRFSDAVYLEIPQAAARERRILLASRRAAHSGKAVPGEVLAVLAERRTFELSELAAEINRTHDLRNTRAEWLSQLFSDQVEVETFALMQFSKNENLQRSLALANESLAQQLKRAEMLASSEFARHRQLTRSLLRYASRTATKATPFGRLCYVAPCEIRRAAAHEREGFTFSGTRAISSAIRLNKLLLPRVVHYLTSHEDIAPHWPLRVASTFQRKDERFEWIRTINGIEGIARTVWSAQLELIVHFAQTIGHASISSLVEQISLHTGIPNEQLTEYLARLRAEGILVPCHFTLEQALDWPARLAEALEEISSPEAKRCALLLREFTRIELRAQVGKADELAGLHANLRRVAQELMGSAALNFEVQSYLFEDSTIDLDATLHVGVSLERALGVLHQLCSLLNRLSMDHDDQAIMALIFEREFGKTASVPLLTFYEIAFRRYFKIALDASGARTSSSIASEMLQPVESTEVVARMHARRRLVDWYQSETAACPRTAELKLRRDQLLEILGDVPAASLHGSSISIFCHVYKAETGSSDWRICMPRAMMALGAGKYFSRFMHLFPPNSADWLLQTLRAGRAAESVEIALDSNFNANLHTPITTKVLRYPTSDYPCDGAGEHLDVQDLNVRLGRDGRVELITRERGDVVVPLDLGFLSDVGRPALYRMLRRFQPASRFHFDFASSATGIAAAAGSKMRADAATKADSFPTVRHFPRVVYEDCIVISRRQWLCEPGSVPEWHPGVPISQYALSLHAWLTLHRLPMRFFGRNDLSLQIETRDGEKRSGTFGANVNRQEVADSATLRKPSVRRDDRKPQYFDLSSPSFVDLFSRLAHAGRTRATILEEAIPDDFSDTEQVGDGVHFEVLLEVLP